MSDIPACLPWRICQSLISELYASRGVIHAALEWVVCRSAADRLCPDAAAHPCLFSWAFSYSSFHCGSSLGLGSSQCTKQMGVSQRARASWQAGVLHGWLHLNTKPRIDTVAHGHIVQWGLRRADRENKRWCKLKPVFFNIGQKLINNAAAAAAALEKGLGAAGRQYITYNLQRRMQHAKTSTGETSVSNVIILFAQGYFYDLENTSEIR